MKTIILIMLIMKSWYDGNMEADIDASYKYTPKTDTMHLETTVELTQWI